MSQANQQAQDAVPSNRRVRKDWELFWRVIAILMLVAIGWLFWVLYQIAPRSVATQLAYAYQVKPIGTQQSAAEAAVTLSSPQSTAAATAAQVEAAAAGPAQPSPEAAAAAVAMDQAQAGTLTGAHQAAADVQAAALDERKEQLQRVQHIEHEGLKLAPEITTPLAERKRIPKKE